jgi:hypothetical protein
MNGGIIKVCYKFASCWLFLLNHIHNIVFNCTLSSAYSPSVQLRQYTDQVRIPLFHTTVVTRICGQGTKQIHRFLISERVSYTLTFYRISPPAWHKDQVLLYRYCCKLLSVRWCVTLFKWCFTATHECRALLALHRSKHLSIVGDHWKNSINFMLFKSRRAQTAQHMRT